MKLTSSVRALLAFALQRPRVESDMEEELRSHLQQRADDLERQGLPRAEAERQARLEFGGLEKYKEECREALGSRLIGELLADVRYGLRQLRRDPGFATVAVLTLALGIGANTGMFTVVNTVLLHPLPYPDSNRIVNVTRRGGGSVSVPMFTYWEQNNPGFSNLAAYSDQAYADINLSVGNKPELVKARQVSRGYFRLFGANPILGRTFTVVEDSPKGPQVLVMSYGLWQRRFGGDPGILGKTLTLGGALYAVIGVLSPSFKPYPPADVWTPLQADPSSTDQAHVLTVAGRLPAGMTLAQANSRMAVIGKEYVQTHSQQLGNDDKLQVTPMRQVITGDIQPALLILMAAVGLVLLIACANVANLLMARGAGRQKDIAVRVAMGAGRGRIVRQLLTQSLLLCLTGGLVGMTLGSWEVRALLALAPGNLPRAEELAAIPAMDPRVAEFTVLLSLVTGIVFGLFPSIQASRVDLNSMLKEESANRTSAGLAHRRASNALVVAEVAIAFILLCGAVLLIRSSAALHTVDPGFDPRNLLSLRVSLAGPNYEQASVVDRLARQIVDPVDRLPGVESSALASSLPFGPISDMLFDIPGRPPVEGYKFTGDVLWCFVSTQYFRTLRIPLRSGRLFREQEQAHTVIVNEAMEHKFWPGQNAVGQAIWIGAGLGPGLDQGATEIVGVVGNVHDRLDADPPPTMYQIWSNVPDGALRLTSRLFPASVAVRTKPGVAPMATSQAAKQALLAGDAQLPTTDVETMAQVVNPTVEHNFTLMLLGVFSTIALILATVGIYGVVSYSVSRRTREIGIRMTLGADITDVRLLVIGQGMTSALAGIGIGIVGAFGLTRALSSLLFGVKSTGPLTFLAVSLILTSVALLATYIPARRATKVDPIVALRYE